MAPGKIASQAGHAYLGAYLQAIQTHPQTATDYHRDGLGTKVCLQASFSQILAAKDAAEQAGLPTFLVVDSGCADFFEGKPTITALGIGPANIDQLPKKIRKLQLL